MAHPSSRGSPMMISRAQLSRLVSIDFHLTFLGEVSCREHKDRFGLATASATRDMALYKDFVTPGHIGFDDSRKVYVATGLFKPVYQHETSLATCLVKSGYTPIALTLQEVERVHRTLHSLYGTPSHGDRQDE